LGRDHYVKIVTEGFLLPFAHRAALVTITERRFDDGVPGTPASLHTRYFVVVREHEKHYDASTAPTAELGRTMPLTRVTVKTLVTPDITPPSGVNSFWVDVDGAHFPFHFEGEDVAGQVVVFTSPIYFVGKSDLQYPSKIASFNSAYVSDAGSLLDFVG